LSADKTDEGSEDFNVIAKFEDLYFDHKEYDADHCVLGIFKADAIEEVKGGDEVIVGTQVLKNYYTVYDWRSQLLDDDKDFNEPGYKEQNVKFINIAEKQPTIVGKSTYTPEFIEYNEVTSQKDKSVSVGDDKYVVPEDPNPAPQPDDDKKDADTDNKTDTNTDTTTDTDKDQATTNPDTNKDKKDDQKHDSPAQWIILGVILFVLLVVIVVGLVFAKKMKAKKDASNPYAQSLNADE